MLERLNKMDDTNLCSKSIRRKLNTLHNPNRTSITYEIPLPLQFLDFCSIPIISAIIYLPNVKPTKYMERKKSVHVPDRSLLLEDLALCMTTPTSCD